ncbi:tld protein [Cystoisospora suis]|uniref:Tld protein n=1 Tax=Cystoisospora suis TaxID=483139 RepID=A0A2C6KGP1_9APIC|nr:tld protein [Cystoisospora suis]
MFLQKDHFCCLLVYFADGFFSSPLVFFLSLSVCLSFFPPRADIYELEDVTDFHLLLTEEGKEAARRLLWCLNALHGALEFCPVLPPLTCVLLLFFDESTAYIILHCLVKKAIERERSDNGPPFMPFRRKDFVR